jgi:hypothetical protein
MKYICDHSNICREISKKLGFSSIDLGSEVQVRIQHSDLISCNMQECRNVFF